MTLFDNPFYILGVYGWSDKTEIIEAMEDLELEDETANARVIADILLKPNSRINAEVAWLPDFNAERVSKCLDVLKSSHEYGVCKDRLSARVDDYTNWGCTSLNIYVQLLQLIDRSDALEYLKDAVLEISQEYDDIGAQTLMNNINIDRREAGIPEIVDIEVVYRALEVRKQEIIKLILDKLALLGFYEKLDILTDLIEEDTDEGEETPSQIIERLIEDYALNNRKLLSDGIPRINELINSLKKSLEEKSLSDDALNLRIDSLLKTVRQWDRMAQPIQVYKRSKGLEDESSSTLAIELRSLAIFLYNKHDKYNATRKIIDAMQEIFAESFEITEKLDEDIEKLEEIEEHYKEIEREAIENAARLNRIAMEREAQKRREEEEESRIMNYSAYIGEASNNLIRTTRDYVSYNGSTIFWDDVEHIMWGSTINKGFFSNTTTYYIGVWGTDGSRIEIVSKDSNANFDNVQDKIWRGAGIRLMLQFVERFRDGLDWRIGDLVIHNDGISILDSNDRPTFFDWNNMSCALVDGELKVGGRGRFTSIPMVKYYDMPVFLVLLRFMRDGKLNTIGAMLD